MLAGIGWYGGGRLARDLTLPALRRAWRQDGADQQRFVGGESVDGNPAALRGGVAGPAGAARGDLEPVTMEIERAPVARIRRRARTPLRRRPGCWRRGRWLEGERPGPLARAAPGLARSGELPAHAAVPSARPAARASGLTLFILSPASYLTPGYPGPGGVGRSRNPPSSRALALDGLRNLWSTRPAPRSWSGTATAMCSSWSGSGPPWSPTASPDSTSTSPTYNRLLQDPPARRGMGPVSVRGRRLRMGRDRDRLGSSGSHHWPQPRPRPSSQAPDAPEPCGAEVRAWARATGLAIGRMVAVTVQSRSPHAPQSQSVLEAVLERITYANEDAGCIIARVATERTGPDLLTTVGPLLGAQA